MVSMRSLRVVGAVGLSAGIALAQPGGYPAVEIDGRAALEDLKLLETAYETMHAGYDRFAEVDTLETKAREIRREVRRGTTDAEFLRLLNEYVGLVRCNHTRVNVPAALNDWRMTNASELPARFVVLGDGEDRGLYVDIPGDAGLRRGDRIVSINGQAAGDILDTLGVFAPIDGYTDHVRRQRLVWNGLPGGSYLNTFFPIVYGPSETFRFELERDGETNAVEATPITLEAWRELDPSTRFYSDFGPDAISVEYVEDTAGEPAAIISVETFVNYRLNLDPIEVYRPFFAEINARGIDHLIVDLRRNGGGSDDAQKGLIAYLLDDPYASQQEQLARTINFPASVKPHIRTWDPSLLEPDPAGFEAVEPNLMPTWGGDDWLRFLPTKHPVYPAAEGGFAGSRLTLLTSRRNGSGAANFMALMKTRDAGRLVGEATGGSADGPTAGILFTLVLPNSGFEVLVPMFYGRNNFELPGLEAGMGVSPDDVVEITPAGYFAGRDEVLEAALGR